MGAGLAYQPVILEDGTLGSKQALKHEQVAFGDQARAPWRLGGCSLGGSHGTRTTKTGAVVRRAT